jgi:hypothetical protein
MERRIYFRSLLRGWAKVLLARRFCQETTMSLKWIAQRLQMGSWTYVSNLLNEPPETRAQSLEVLPLCQ